MSVRHCGCSLATLVQQPTDDVMIPNSHFCCHDQYDSVLIMAACEDVVRPAILDCHGQYDSVLTMAAACDVMDGCR